MPEDIRKTLCYFLAEMVHLCAFVGCGNRSNNFCLTTVLTHCGDEMARLSGERRRKRQNASHRSDMKPAFHRFQITVLDPMLRMRFNKVKVFPK